MSDKPDLQCDLIMKGGTTSGVVYPRAVRRLLGKYQLVNVGGTSAGAIAAGAAAAAEIGRDRGSLEKLDQIAAELPKRLRSLFQPRPEARVLLDVGLRFVENPKSQWKAVAGSILVLARHYWGAATFWILVFVAALVILFSPLTSRHSIPFSVFVAFLCMVLCFVAWSLTSLIRLLQLAKRELSKENGFGLCPGATQRSAGGRKIEAFADWMSAKLNDLAGMGLDQEKPLTFGDLRDDGVNLVVLTTSITDGAPVTVPFAKNSGYYFRRKDLDGKIPACVVDWMVKISKPEKEGSDYFHMPDPENLPVILGIRMSLSFPLLFTVIRLHRRSHHTGQFEPVTFSDGGVTSNFPIHFFDSIWPSRPTFGITLDRTDQPTVKELEPMFGDRSYKEHLPPRGLKSVSDFVVSLLSTMQDWQDIELSNMPAARQRIMHIPLTQEEGGLNLSMPETRIEQLLLRGEQAGEKFGQFDWPNHRWTRYVSSMVAFSKGTLQMRERWQASNDGLRDFVEIYSHDHPTSPPSEWSLKAQQFASELVQSADSAENLEQPGIDVGTRLMPERR